MVSIIIENRSPAIPVWKSESLQRTNLSELCAALTKTVNQYCEDGVGAAMERKDANREGVAAMRRLGEQYPQLAGYYPRPKPLAVVFLFGSAAVRPVFTFTVEANYNREMPITTFRTRSAMSYPICGDL